METGNEADTGKAMIDPTREELSAMADVVSSRDGEIIRDYLSRALQDLDDHLHEPPYDNGHFARCGQTQAVKEFRDMFASSPDVIRNIKRAEKEGVGGIPI